MLVWVWKTLCHSIKWTREHETYVRSRRWKLMQLSWTSRPLCRRFKACTGTNEFPLKKVPLRELAAIRANLKISNGFLCLAVCDQNTIPLGIMKRLLTLVFTVASVYAGTPPNSGSETPSSNTAGASATSSIVTELTTVVMYVSLHCNCFSIERKFYSPLHNKSRQDFVISHAIYLICSYSKNRADRLLQQVYNRVLSYNGDAKTNLGKRTVVFVYIS